MASLYRLSLQCYPLATAPHGHSRSRDIRASIAEATLQVKAPGRKLIKVKGATLTRGQAAQCSSGSEAAGTGSGSQTGEETSCAVRCLPSDSLTPRETGDPARLRERHTSVSVANSLSVSRRRLRLVHLRIATVAEFPSTAEVCPEVVDDANRRGATATEPHVGLAALRIVAAMDA